MNLTALIGLVVLIFVALILKSVWKLVRSPLPLEMQQALEKKQDDKLRLLKEEWSSRLGEELRKVWEQIQGQVQTTEKSVSDKLQQANDTFARVSQEIGRLQEATKKVEEVGRNVASIEDLLRAPKSRGEFGESILEDLIAQMMPAELYAFQHTFSNGERVDAVIRLQGKLVPIDSKFPLDQFRRMGQAVTDTERAEWRRALIRDVKQHIDSISQKYIRPSEQTFDFALMYIPSESVYYETVIREEGADSEQGIFQHALKKRVIPVSPNSFYAYLRVILLGLRGLTLEQRTQEILSGLMKLQKELSSVREDFDATGKQLRYALANFEKAERHLGKFENRFGVIETSQSTTEVLSQPELNSTVSLENLSLNEKDV